MSSRADKESWVADTLSGKLAAMPRSRLGQLILKGRERLNLTYRDVVRLSGNRISKSYVETLEKSEADPVIANDKIVGLAKAFGEPPEVVFLASIGKGNNGIKDSTLAQMLEDFSRLPSRDREELRLMIEMLRKEIHTRLNR